MPLNKSELIDLANQYARELGQGPVSESCFESWIHRDFLEGAQARGIKRGLSPHWSYPDSAAERVKLILALISLGASRANQLVICLWLFGASFPPHRLKHVLKSELRRIVNRQGRRSPWWKCHYDDLANLSERERLKRLGQLPALDAELAASPFALPEDLYFQIGLRAYWGTEDGLGIAALLFGDDLSRSLSPPLVRLFEISGAIGLPGESANDGYDIIDQLLPTDLEQARALYLCSALVLCAAGILLDALGNLVSPKVVVAYQKAATSLWRAEWMVSTAALFAISALNVRCSKPGIKP